MALILQGGDGGNATITGGANSNVAITNTQTLQLPTGNTDQRPSNVSNGAIRYNTTTSSVEGYTAGAWGAIGGGSGGGITWQNVITSNTTVSVGNAYPIDTSSSNVLITLPSNPSAGNVIIITDYKQTFGVHPVTVNPNGQNIYGASSNVTLNNSGESVNMVYIDSTQGWIAYSGFIASPIGTYTVEYLVIAGGGGGGAYGAGGGAGGLVSGTGASGFAVTPGLEYSVTVGAGGAGSPSGHGASGTNSIFSSTTTAIAGGGGGNSASSGYSGGSGGGSGYDNAPAGAGTAGQGNPGGNVPGTVANPYPSGGGGGADATGGNGSGNNGGAGGAGSNSFSAWASATSTGSGGYYAGGGGGSVSYGGPSYGTSGVLGPGGAGGGGAGSLGTNTPAVAGTTNTGGGGGGGGYTNTQAPGANGGSGLVILRYAGASQRGVGGSVSTSGGYTYHTFTSSGTFTA